MAAPISHGVRTVGVIGAGQMGPLNSVSVELVLKQLRRDGHRIRIRLASESPGALVGQVSKNPYPYKLFP